MAGAIEATVGESAPKSGQSHPRAGRILRSWVRSLLWVLWRAMLQAGATRIRKVTTGVADPGGARAREAEARPEEVAEVIARRATIKESLQELVLHLLQPLVLLNALEASREADGRRARTGVLFPSRRAWVALPWQDCTRGIRMPRRTRTKLAIDRAPGPPRDRHPGHARDRDPGLGAVAYHQRANTQVEVQHETIRTSSRTGLAPEQRRLTASMADVDADQGLQRHLRGYEVGAGVVVQNLRRQALGLLRRSRGWNVGERRELRGVSDLDGGDKRCH